MWWYGIDKDINQEVWSCPECQKRNPALLPQPPTVALHATCPWSRVYTDFAGPINDQILIDAHSERIEDHSQSCITATATIQRCRHIFAFGPPEVMVTANAPNFVSVESKHAVPS